MFLVHGKCSGVRNVEGFFSLIRQGYGSLEDAMPFAGIGGLVLLLNALRFQASQYFSMDVDKSKVPAYVEARNGLHKRRISRSELRSFGRLWHILMQCCRGSDLDPLCLGSHVDTLVKNDFYHLDVAAGRPVALPPDCCFSWQLWLETAGAEVCKGNDSAGSYNRSVETSYPGCELRVVWISLCCLEMGKPLETSN